MGREDGECDTASFVHRAEAHDEIALRIIRSASVRTVKMNERAGGLSCGIDIQTLISAFDGIRNDCDDLAEQGHVLVEGNFIDYKTTIPTDVKTEVIINTRVIINSVERMSLLNNDRIQSPVRCNFDNDEIKLSCASAVGRANDSISVSIMGEKVEIGFNNKYLLDALKNCDTDEIRLALSGPIKPMVIKPVKGDSFLSIVVPMRLSNEG